MKKYNDLLGSVAKIGLMNDIHSYELRMMYMPKNSCCGRVMKRCSKYEHKCHICGKIKNFKKTSRGHR